MLLIAPFRGQTFNSVLLSYLLYNPTLQPNSTTTNYTTNTTSYDITKHVSQSIQALERKQGKYQNEVEQGRDHSGLKIRKNFQESTCGPGNSGWEPLQV